MGDYTVQHNYRSTRDGQEFGPWTAGDVVQLDQADADWVNRDSPGALTAAEPAPAPEPAPERQAKATPNRQQRGSRNRGA